jgi:hypothetical protein
MHFLKQAHLKPDIFVRSKTDNRYTRIRMAKDNKVVFNVTRSMVFLGAFPLALFAILIVFLGLNTMISQNWVGFSGLVLIPLFLFFISLFPKYASRVLFCWASEEKKALYIRRFIIVVALVVSVPLIYFLIVLFSRSLIRGIFKIWCIN